LVTANTDVEGQVVFVGYGLKVPEKNYDDFAGVDRLYPALFTQVPWIMRISRPAFLKSYTSAAVRNTLDGLREALAPCFARGEWLLQRPAVDRFAFEGAPERLEVVGLGAPHDDFDARTYARRPWHCLNFLPDPHGQGSLRPTFCEERVNGIGGGAGGADSPSAPSASGALATPVW